MIVVFPDVDTKNAYRTRVFKIPLKNRAFEWNDVKGRSSAVRLKLTPGGKGRSPATIRDAVAKVLPLDER
jgi:hypothetical protein